MSVSKFNQFSFFTQRMLAQFNLKDLEQSQIYTNAYLDYQKQPMGKFIDIPTHKNLSDEDFLNNYYKNGIPVILKGKAKQWSALSKWHPSNLKEKYGKDKILISSNLNTGSNFEVSDTTLDDIINAMENGDNSKYARFNNLLNMHPELLEDLDIKWLKKVTPRLSKNLVYQIFMGAQNTNTSLHAACSHNLFIQIYGKKHWYLISPKHDIALRPPVNHSPYFYSTFDPSNPDYKTFPSMKHVDIYEFELEEGDILFNPSSYWHQVKNQSASIGLGVRWFDFKTCLKLNFTQFLLLLTATNPSLRYVLKNQDDYSKVFRYISEKTK